MTAKEKSKLTRLAGFLEGLSYGIKDYDVGEAISTVIEEIDKLLESEVGHETD